MAKAFFAHHSIATVQSFANYKVDHLFDDTFMIVIDYWKRCDLSVLLLLLPLKVLLLLLILSELLSQWNWSGGFSILRSR